MRKLLFVVLCILCSISVFTQDIIVCNDARRIDAIITEVSATEVKYKKITNPDGPIFVMEKSEIQTILYSDGEVWLNEAKKVKTSTNISKNDQKSTNLKFNPEPIGKKHNFGIIAGYAQKCITGYNEKMGWTSVNDDEKNSPTLVVGFNLSPEIKYGIGIQTGIYYEMCRGTYNGIFTYYNSYALINVGITYYDVQCEIMDHALVFPVQLRYRYEIIPDLSIFLYTGPSFEVGLAYDFQISIPSYNREGTIDLYENELNDITFNRFRMYWGVGGGIQWKHIQLRMGGDWGLTNIMENKTYKLNKPFNICLSYMF